MTNEEDLENKVSEQEEKLQKVLDEKKVQLAAVNKKKQEKVEKIFCRKIYPKISAVTSTVSDAIPVSIGDITLVGGLANMLLKATGKVPGVTKAMDSVLKVNKYQRMAGNLTAMAQENRVPLEEKLNLNLKEYNKGHLKSDINKLADRITDSYNSMDKSRSLDDYNSKANTILSKTFMEIEGYDFKTPQRVKGSIIMRLMSKLGAKGLFDPARNEVILPPGMDFFTPFALVHEKSHSKGYIRENEANMMAYKTCLESKDPNFMYSAFASRLNYTIKTLHSKENHDGDAKKAVEAQKDMIDNLNIPQELKDEMVSGYKTGKIVSKIQTGFAKFLDFQLKTRGQKDGIKGYSVGFIKAARAYDKNNGGL